MYQHTVQYYETDKMGITHHSNYIRWMEEARIAFQKALGFGYDELEALGVISPVVSVECNYKKTSTFADVINIDVKVEEFRGVKLKLAYRMEKENGDLVCEAKSTHCFLNAEGKPVKLSKVCPELDAILTAQVQEK